MTCLRGSSVAVAEDFGGFGFTDTLLGWLTRARGRRRGASIVRHFVIFGRSRRYAARPVVRSFDMVVRRAATGSPVDPGRAAGSAGFGGARPGGRPWPTPRSERGASRATRQARRRTAPAVHRARRAPARPADLPAS